MNASESVSHAHHSLNSTVAKITANGTAGAATLAPADVMGQYLNTHGVWVLSYAEWIKVIGVIWISILIIETTIKHIRAIIKKVKK